MIIVASIFWIVGLILSVIMGPTLTLWTWGPTMLCFAAAIVCVVPEIWRGSAARLNPYVLVTGLATAIWFAARAWFSPVKEFALIDLSLVSMAVSTFIVMQCVFRNKIAQNIIISGIALLLVGNLAVMIAEYRNIDYRFLIPYETKTWPSGFFRHHSHCATFLIASSMILFSFGLRGTLPYWARIILIFLAVIGASAIYFTKSRSGFIGVGCAFMSLIIYWIFIAKRDDKKWSGVALVLVPLILMAMIVALVPLLVKIQQTRTAGSDLTDMLDNNIRLILYGISLPCIALHAWFGGGSRSFSWEVYQFWDIENMGAFTSDPEHVHNELLQVATDYGIIGTLILLMFVVGIWVLCSFRSLAKGQWSHYPNADAWRLGGIAAWIGLFAQSNFEGTLRIAPGAILLGLCLAAASHDLLMTDPSKKIHHWSRKISLIACSLILVLYMSMYGFKGTNVARELWSGVMLNPSAGHEEKISSYTKALGKWNLESFYSERGALYFDLANQNSNRSDYRELLDLALEDYKAAMVLHPYTPLHPRNAANTLRLLYRFDDANAYYQKAAMLQGGMEAVYNVRYLYADNLHQIGLHQLQHGDYAKAIRNYELAIEQLSKFPAYSYGSTSYELRTACYINLGIALEQSGDVEKALAQYEAFNRAQTDYTANYYIAVMFLNRAKAHRDSGRFSEALRLLIEADKRFQTHPQLPKDLPADTRAKVMELTRKQIEELRTANHLPSEDIQLK